MFVFMLFLFARGGCCAVEGLPAAVPLSELEQVVGGQQSAVVFGIFRRQHSP